MADIRAERLTDEQYAKNFDDLVPPLDGQLALVEASRCYFCHDAPCIEACPTAIDIPSFIRKIQTDNLRGSAMDILSANIMGGTCARVCPTEILCEQVCVRTKQEGKPVEIGRLQRFATDWLFDRGIQPFERLPVTGRRVAVVGAGPAGLACAHRLAEHGHDAVIFEQRAKPGGLNEHGIAAYKMAGDFAQREVDFITSLGGIDIQFQTALGRDISLEDLRERFDAVFLAIGADSTNRLGLDHETADGIQDAVDFIERIRQSPDKSSLPIGKDVIVVGGGNTAIDISIQSKRLGAQNVTMIYRRGHEEMGATGHEQEVAKLNGVVIRYWSRPRQIVVKGNQLSAVAVEGTVADQDGGLSGTGEVEVIKADQLFKAIGQRLDADGLQALAMEGRKIAVNDARATSIKGVFAGGDAVHGDDLTVTAVQDGKIAANAIHQYLQA